MSLKADEVGLRVCGVRTGPRVGRKLVDKVLVGVLSGFDFESWDCSSIMD